jgi:hypothetical protein
MIEGDHGTDYGAEADGLDVVVAGVAKVPHTVGQDLQAEVEIVPGFLLGGSGGRAEKPQVASGGGDEPSVQAVAGGLDAGGADVEPDKDAFSGQYRPRS